VAETISRKLTVQRGRLRRASRVLEATYGTPDLGNLPDPLDEAVYILLTYQTDIPRARAVWASLRATFETWAAIEAAPHTKLAGVLRPAGLHDQKARAIQRLLATVRTRVGGLTLDHLRHLSPSEAERELRALPGLDFKGARCVQMYSLGHRVFPVDSNAFRFMQRFGVVARRSVYRRRATHDRIQQLVPPSVRHALHVNLVVHGQTRCRPAHPLCGACPLRRACRTGRERGRT
jgi:endonuclease III